MPARGTPLIQVKAGAAVEMLPSADAFFQPES